jgi:hypothetical protein
LQQIRRTTKQIDGIAAQDNARTDVRQKTENKVCQRHQANIAAADAQQQGFGNMVWVMRVWNCSINKCYNTSKTNPELAAIKRSRK